MAAFGRSEALPGLGAAPVVGLTGSLGAAADEGLLEVADGAIAPPSLLAAEDRDGPSPAAAPPDVQVVNQPPQVAGLQLAPPPPSDGPVPAPFVPPRGMRISGHYLPSEYGLDFEAPEFAEAVKQGLWKEIEPARGKGFQTNADVDEASRRVAAEPSMTGDFEADPELRAFVVSIARNVSQPAIRGGADVERAVTIGRNARGHYAVTSIGLPGPQGGTLTLPAGSTALAHVHLAGSPQPPHKADLQAAKHNIPSFVIGQSSGHVWEIGRVGGVISIRRIDSPQPEPWEPYQEDPRRYAKRRFN
ncbi:MAG TPA: hypothetical protein VG939_19760 [Caulobacteraceae bacterium]|nr:hypothetical protein [Caulobacteraceae bacterium]